VFGNPRFNCEEIAGWLIETYFELSRKTNTRIANAAKPTPTTLTAAAKLQIPAHKFQTSPLKSLPHRLQVSNLRHQYLVTITIRP
jgi:hypothetical protein